LGIFLRPPQLAGGNQLLRLRNLPRILDGRNPPPKHNRTSHGELRSP
jgi:hypothetical protein